MFTWVIFETAFTSHVMSRCLPYLRYVVSVSLLCLGDEAMKRLFACHGKDPYRFVFREIWQLYFMGALEFIYMCCISKRPVPKWSWWFGQKFRCNDWLDGHTESWVSLCSCLMRTTDIRLVLTSLVWRSVQVPCSWYSHFFWASAVFFKSPCVSFCVLSHSS